MANAQDILTVYAALAEHIYRRDSNTDQPLSLGDISKVLGLPTPFTVPTKDAEGNPLPIEVIGPDGTPLGNLKTDGNYYYSSDSAFSGMIVQIGGKFVVVLRGTDSATSGWSSAWKALIDQNYPFFLPRRKKTHTGHSMTVKLILGTPSRMVLLDLERMTPLSGTMQEH